MDRTLLERLTHWLAFRGPDAESSWCGEAVGMGHTLLRTTLKLMPAADSDTECDKQPANFGERLWIVADARIDARAELIGKLKAKSGMASGVSLATPDAILILHAYNVWSDSCIEHLIGDFSFAIWDDENRKLFCARDQFGVKPFFFARVGSCFIFSNTLDCIRRHPAVSSGLNDLAIADFLLFDTHQDPEATSFADIQRLPPAHTLTCEHEKICVRPYWALPAAKLLPYKREEEYLERFRELFDTAVADRLRTDHAGVLMSGGLDSPLVAAAASRRFSENANAVGLRAYTDVIMRLIPHDERHYAALVADSLKIPIEYVVSDDSEIFDQAEQPENYTPEPAHLAWPHRTRDQLGRLAIGNRVALTGYGGDPTLTGRISVHFRELFAAGKFGRALMDAARYFTTQGRLSRLYLRKRWMIVFDSKSFAPRYPAWLNEDLERRLDLRERWRFMNQPAPSVAAARPEAHQDMVSLLWADLFEEHDAGVTRIPIEVRHPFFDLRLVNFLLALPRLPWCCDKQILREAARGVLPEEVRLRRKSPLHSDPLIALLQKPQAAWVDRFRPVPEFEHYVARNRIPPVYQEKQSLPAWINLRPLSLNFWLPQSTAVD